MIGYVTLGTNDLMGNAPFYDAIAKEMGFGRMMDFDTFIAWGEPGRAAVKQVSLVVRLEGLDAEGFADRYRRHAAVAEAHHGMARYVQNPVVDGPHGLDAVSELSFESERSWVNDFYLLADSAEVVREDVRGFIDLRATSSALVAEKVVRP